MTAGVKIFDKSPNPFLVLSKEAYGLGSVAIEPGYEVGINDGNCSFTALLTASKTASTLGARLLSLLVTADNSTRNTRLESKKGVPVHTPKLCSLV